MIYLERTVVIENSTAYIEEPIYLYKGDKNIEVRFSIQNNPFKYKNTLAYNYGQLIIKRDTAPNIFSEVTKLSGGKIILTITGDMIDELEELGSYTFQIRLFNENMSSRGTLPPVENGIVIVEPLCEEPLEPPKVYINPDFYEIRTSGGTNYNGLFSYCSSLTSLDLSNFNTSNVTDMSYMFYDCEKLTSLDVSNFDTSKVTTMLGMFFNCSKLTELNMSNCDVGKVTTFSSFVIGCTALTNFSAPKNISAAIDVSKCPNLTHDSLMSIINNLATVTSTKKLTLGATNLAKLTDEEKAIATGKNWTLA